MDVRATVAICAMMLAAAPVAASSRSEQWHDAPAAKARAIAVAYTRCAVREDRNAVVAFLAEPVGTDDPAALARALPSRCLNGVAGNPGGRLTFSPLLVRGMLFEALYARDFGKRPVAPTFASVPARSYEVAGLDTPGQSYRHDYRALMKIGDCTVRAAPERTRALLATVAASDGEARALADLHDGWTGCLPGGRDVPFTVEVIRATLAEPLYRLTEADETAR